MEPPLSDDYLRAHTVGELKPLAAPIRVVEYDPEWPHRSRTGGGGDRGGSRQDALRIEHVGSTAGSPVSAAKPIIDILLVVAHSAQEAEYLPLLESAGYQLHIREPEWHEHRMLKGGDTDVNLHVFSTGCPEIDKMLGFRDWLRSDAGDRDLYARTKVALAQQDWIYTQNYADAKTAVIEEILQKRRGAGWS